MDYILGFSILAVLAALTVLSHRNPSAFRRAAIPLLFFSVLSVLFLSVYNFGGVGVNVDNLIHEAGKSDAEAAVMNFYAQRVSDRYQMQVKTLLIGGGVSAYLVLLLSLPNILNRKARTR